MFVGIANNIYANKILGDTSSAAILALLGESDGLAIEFDDDFYESARGLYGSIAVKDTTTPLNNIATTPYELLSYNSPSVKYCRGPDGNLRYGAHNLCLQSEDFSNQAWVKNNATVVADTSIDPVAYKLVPNATQTNGNVSQTINVISGMSYAFSFLAKAGEEDEVAFVSNMITTFRAVVFDLTNGSVKSAGTGWSGTIVDKGDGKYLCTATGTADGTGSKAFQISNNLTDWIGDGTSGVYIWKAHLRRTPSDDTYLKTTDEVVYELPYEWGVNEFVNPDSPETQVISVDDESSYTVIVKGPGSVTLSGAATGTVAADLARTFKMDGTSLTVTVNGSPTFVHVGEALGIRVEEQRTNLSTYSEQFDDVSWAKLGATITENATTAPNGTTTADKLVPDNTEINGRISKTVNVTDETTYTFSFFAKAAEEDEIAFVSDMITTFRAVVFDLANGTVKSAGTGWTGSVQKYVDGWYRCIAVGTADSTAAKSFQLSNNTTDWIGDGTSGVYIWGAQLEAGSFPTSYIQTAGSTVTRAGDNISLATSKFPVGATEGTLFAEYTVHGAVNTNTYIVTLSDGTNQNMIVLRAFNQDQFLQSLNGMVNTLNTGSIAIGVRRKLAGRYKPSDYAVCKDGGVIVTDTNPTSAPEVDLLNIGPPNSPVNGVFHLRQFIILPRPMTDNELQTLTGA